MKFAAPKALAVPAGTAVAIVVSREPHADPTLEMRRWERIAALDHSAQREALELLVTAGVFTVLHDAVLVVRIVREGSRAIAAIVASPAHASPSGGQTPPTTAAEHLPEPASTGQADSIALHDHAPEFSEALLAATRIRPIFHGTTSDGTTYSGFVADDAASILDALSAAVAAHQEVRETIPRGNSPLLAVFSGPSVALPPGLATAI
ncbi:MAG: hypothetical protein RL591_694 [Planctomycetota bacterium]